MIFKLQICSIAVFIGLLSLCLAQEDYQVLALNEHNRLRALHGSSPLVLNNMLNNQAVLCALDYAQRQSLDGRCSSVLKLGENILKMDGDNEPNLVQTMLLAVTLWYSESTHYNYNDPANSTGDTGHFTQLVWEGSRILGCGISTVFRERVVVCLYDPPGNVLLGPRGSFELYIANVRPPLPPRAS